MKHNSSSDFSDNDPLLKYIKLSDGARNRKSLQDFSQEKCEFCDELFFCSYDMLVHNATHIIIPLKDELVQCKDCGQHFASSMDLNIHTKIYHFKVPDVLNSLVISKPVVRCDNSIKELVFQSNERKLEKILNKKAVVECDSTVNELIETKKVEKLKDFVTKQPYIRCEDTLKDVLLSNCNNESEKLKKDLINSPKVVLKSIDSEKLKIDLLNTPKVVLKAADNEQLKTKLISTPKVIDITGNEKLKTDLLNIPKVVLKNNDLSPNNVKEKLQDTVNKSVSQETKIDSKTNGTSIKSRLIFEDEMIGDDDFEEDIISTQVNGVNDSKTDNDVCDLTLDDSDEEEKWHPDNYTASINKSIPNRNMFYLGNKQHTETKTVDSSQTPDIGVGNLAGNFAPAVHYEDLINPSLWQCKICRFTFQNRYDLIIHETTQHFQLKKGAIHQKIRVCSVCEKYVVGNHWTLKHHMEDKHPYAESHRNLTLKKCTQCHLKYYSYAKHSKNYHFIYNCKTCSKSFEQESLLNDHTPICRGMFESHNYNLTENSQHRTEMGALDRIGMEKIIKVCELCSLFFKNTQNYKYVLLRDYSEQGRRITCQRCEKQFFEVKLIKLINRHPIVQPSYEYVRKTTPGVSSNEERLKKIRQRLKLMNKRC